MREKKRRFILTNYVFPINTPIQLSDKYHFENPESYKESQLIRVGLTQLLKSGSGVLNTGSFLSEESLVKQFDKFVLHNQHLQFKHLDYKNKIDTIASNVVILSVSYYESVPHENDEEIAFDDSIEKDFLSFIKTIDLALFSTFNNKFNPSLSIDSIFMLDHFSQSNIKNDSLINTDLTDNYMFPNLFTEKAIGLPEYFHLRFDELYDRINANLTGLLKEPNQKICSYIADSICSLRYVDNDKLSLLLVISLLEFMLTHKTNEKNNPTDSIKSQLKRNISTLEYLETGENNLKNLSIEISLIYDLRSNIAHGNFDSIPDSLGKLRKLYASTNEFIKNSKHKDLYKGESFVLFNTVNRAKYFLRITLRKFIKDRDFIEHIKM